MYMLEQKCFLKTKSTEKTNPKIKRDMMFVYGYNFNMQKSKI